MSSSSKAKAEQAKARAEERFRRKDVAGARAAALDAKSHFPGLPGLAPALAAYQVHFAAATRRLPTGAVDWHAVLDVPRDAAADAVKRQFKRLCLLTHPDKNASAAADGAFKLVVKAYENVSAAFASATAPPAAGRRQRGAAASTGGQSGAGVSGFHSYPTGSRPGTSTSASSSSSSFSGRRPGPNFSGFSSFPTGSRPQRPSTSASDSATATDDDDGIRARVVEIAMTCPYCGSGSIRVAVNGDRVTATVPCQRCCRYFAVPEKERR